MRILYLTLKVPFPPTDGHRIHLWSSLRALAEEGHEVILVSFAGPNENGVAMAPLRSLCKAVDLIPWVQSTYESRDYLKRLRALPSARPYAALQSLSADFAACVQRHLECQVFDAVICDEIFTVPSLPPELSVPVLVDTIHVAHGLLERYLSYVRNPLKRLYIWTEYQKMRRWEADICSQVSIVGACSEAERAIFERLCPGARVVLIPNVVDVDNYRPSPETESAALLYSGVMDWYPNQDAVEFFASEILPRIRKLVPQVKFRVAGRSASAGTRRRFTGIPGIEFAGTVPDMRAVIARATVCVVPLRIGSGTRLKILEAAAMAKPIVSTRVGAEGLEFVDGREIVLADEPEAFARAVADLLMDNLRRQKLGQAARRRVERQYSLKSLRAAMHQAMEELRKRMPAVGRKEAIQL